jgi:glycosyltransferase involved in cell wall biosynthesis
VTPTPPIALVHDYLTQRGGAERVVLTLADSYPDAAIHTSLYDPAGTFPGFAEHDVRTLPLDRVALLRDHHRLALPLLAPAFSRLHVDAEVTICSSSGWAHGAHASGAKVVYCHNPARWLYQTDQYLAGSSSLAAVGLALLTPPLRRWDSRAAATADRYLVNSRAVRARVADIYGIDADVVPPPVDIDVAGPRRPVPGVEPGFLLCVSRLLAYKNVGAVAEAFAIRPDRRLVVVGSGPLAEELTAGAPPNVTVVGRVDDDELRWLYGSCRGLIAASYEDFGLTPVEAAAFGAPTAALRWGGFLDTIVDGSTGCYFDEPTPERIAVAVDQLVGDAWSAETLKRHAEQFRPERFASRMAELVEEVRRAR